MDTIPFTKNRQHIVKVFVLWMFGLAVPAPSFLEAGQPAPSPTVQEEKAGPAESGEVQERSVKERGAPGTATRNAWCADRFTECLLQAHTYCIAFGPFQEAQCELNQISLCNGAQSTCNTLPQITLPGTGVITPPTVLAPPNQAPLSPAQRIAPSTNMTISPRGVEGEPPAEPTPSPPGPTQQPSGTK